MEVATESEDYPRDICRVCDGTGKIEMILSEVEMVVEEECRFCKGTGEVIPVPVTEQGQSSICGECDGRGTVTVIELEGGDDNPSLSMWEETCPECRGGPTAHTEVN